MNQKLKNNQIFFYISVFILGTFFGISLLSLIKVEEKPEIANINTDSVCVNALKLYYLEQNPEIKKKIINNAAKKMSIDKMLSNEVNINHLNN